MVVRDEPTDHPYPPDALTRRLPVPVSFTTLAIVGVVLVAAVDWLVFVRPTVVPYNYPFFLDIVLFVAALVAIREGHRSYDEVKRDLVRVSDTWGDHQFSPGGDHASPAEIRAAFDRTMAWAFAPRYLFAGGLAVGTVVTVVLWGLDLTSVYPYHLMNFLYGAAHGILIAPLAGGAVLSGKLIDRFMTDMNLLDPDGVGGYQVVGQALVRGAIYGVLLATLDFAILFTFTFTDQPLFMMAVVVAYSVELLLLVGVTLYVSLRVRRRLLYLRDEKAHILQAEFGLLEEEYWRGIDVDRDTASRASDISAVVLVFDQMRRMDLWIVDVYSLTKLALSVVFSLLLFFAQIELLPTP